MERMPKATSDKLIDPPRPCLTKRDFDITSRAILQVQFFHELLQLSASLVSPFSM